MAIGEFGGAPAATGDNGPMYAAPAYWFYEMSQAALNPSRAFADAVRLFYRNPANPLSYTAFGKTMAASLELFERSAEGPAAARPLVRRIGRQLDHERRAREGGAGGAPAEGAGGVDNIARRCATSD